MVLGLAAVLNAVLIYPEGASDHSFRSNQDASIDSGKLDRSLRGEGLAGTAGAGVEGRGCADEDFGLVAGEE